MAEGWWEAGEACPEDGITFCGRCRPHHYPASVWITRGWSNAFHRTNTCRALASGQRRVDARGGDTAPVVQVAIQVALGERREPCQACFPPPDARRRP